MKICPVCNDSFADELKFCDIDGTRLAREGAVQGGNKWWSLIGAGLLVGALIISAASIFFMPKARVSSPVSSESQPTPSVAKPPVTESASNVTAPPAGGEPEIAAADAVVPEAKKRDRASANTNAGGAAPNPKAAALAAEAADKGSTSGDSNKSAPSPPKNPEPPPAVKTVSDARPAETPKPQPSSDLRKDQKPQPTAKSSDKDSNNKKKNDDKDKKKGGGFLRVFKKIFGKD